MRVNPRILLNYIVLLCAIFGTLALIIGILIGDDIVRSICAILIFFIGWTAAKFHNSL